jgi:RNA polymerase sigma factor (sigma-70 family)
MTKKSHSEIVEENIALVKSIAKRFHKTRISDFNDYVNVGVMAFMKCLETYDISKGKISTYATRPILWAITKEFLRDSKSVKTKTLTDKYDNLSYVEPENFYDYLPDDLSQRELDIIVASIQGCTPQEIADKIGITRFSVYRIIKGIKSKVLNA